MSVETRYQLKCNLNDFNAKGTVIFHFIVNIRDAKQLEKKNYMNVSTCVMHMQNSKPVYFLTF